PTSRTRGSPLGPALSASFRAPFQASWSRRKISDMSPVVRAPAVAGLFYPQDRDELGALVDRLLSRAHPPAHAQSPKAIVPPHAAMVSSGRMAAGPFKRFEPTSDRIRRIVLIGPAHRVHVDGLASPGAAALATPLGQVPVDGDALAKLPDVPADARAHARE